VHAGEADRRFLVVDAVPARIHHRIELDVGIGGSGEVADLAGAGEEVGCEVDYAGEGEGRVAVGGIAVGIDQVRRSRKATFTRTNPPRSFPRSPGTSARPGDYNPASTRLLLPREQSRVEPAACSL